MVVDSYFFFLLNTSPISSKLTSQVRSKARRSLLPGPLKNSIHMLGKSSLTAFFSTRQNCEKAARSSQQKCQMAWNSSMGRGSDQVSLWGHRLQNPRGSVTHDKFDKLKRVSRSPSILTISRNPIMSSTGTPAVGGRAACPDCASRQGHQALDRCLVQRQLGNVSLVTRSPRSGREVLAPQQR